MSFYGGSAATGTLVIPKWNLTYPGKIPVHTVSIETQTEYEDMGPDQHLPIEFTSMRRKLVPVFRHWYGNLEVWTVLPFDLEKWLMVKSEGSDRQLLGRVQITMHRGQGKSKPFRYDFEGVGELFLDRAQLELPV